MTDALKEAGDILAAGLNLIHEGQESIDSWLGRFPEYKEILRPSLEAAEWLQVRGPIFDPHPEFVAISRRSLVRQILVEQSLSSLLNGPRDTLCSDNHRKPRKVQN